MWVSLIINRSECLVCDLFLHWINSFLYCFQKKNCTALNQSEWKNFFMCIKWRNECVRISEHKRPWSDIFHILNRGSWNQVAQLVRASHRYREVTGSNPVEVLTLSGSYTQLLKIAFITAMIIAYLIRGLTGPTKAWVEISVESFQFEQSYDSYSTILWSPLK